MDWAYNDSNFYKENKAWIDTRIAEIYNAIGKHLIETGKLKEARECFKNGLYYDKNFKKNLNSLWLSFFPRIVRKVYNRIIRK